MGGRRENTVLRAQLDPSLVSVIPNALIAEQFKPDPAQQQRPDDPNISKTPSYPILHRHAKD